MVNRFTGNGLPNTHLQIHPIKSNHTSSIKKQNLAFRQNQQRLRGDSVHQHKYIYLHDFFFQKETRAGEGMSSTVSSDKLLRNKFRCI